MLLVYQGRPLPPILKGLSRVFFNDAKCFVVQQPCAAQQNGRTWQEFLDKKRCCQTKWVLASEIVFDYCIVNVGVVSVHENGGIRDTQDWLLE